MHPLKYLKVEPSLMNSRFESNIQRVAKNKLSFCSKNGKG